MSNYILSLKNVTKRFKNETILEDVSLQFKTGTVYGIIGRNGSGKTLLFKMICGFVLPTSGEVWAHGERIGDSNTFPNDTGIVIEKSGFIGGYSGFDNLKYLTKLNKDVSDSKIEETLCKVGLEPKSKKKYRHYSLGMKQKLAIAQAILEDPQILILDEPFNSLDEQSIVKIKQIVMEYKKNNKLVLIASHNPLDIEELCDETYQVENRQFSRITN